MILSANLLTFSNFVHDIFNYRQNKWNNKKFVPFLHRSFGIRHLYYHDFYCQDYTITHKRKYIDFKYQQLLPTTKFCKFSGYAPFYVGYKQDKAYKCNTAFLHYLNYDIPSKLTPEEVKAMMTPRICYQGGYSTNLNVVKRFTNEVNQKYSSKEIWQILQEEGFPWLKLPKMGKLSLNDLDRVRVNLDSHPGFYTQVLAGATKRQALPISLKLAKHALKKIFTTRYKYTGTWSLGGRSKPIKLTNERTDCMTRAVWIPETFLSLISLICVQPFTLALKGIQRNCIFVGSKYDYDLTKWMSFHDKMHDFSISSDFSLFDSDVTPEFIQVAVALIRSCYPDDAEHDRYFAFISDTLINKQLVLPPGVVYHISKGIPSGHPFVSLVGTLVNYIAFILTFRRVYGAGNVSSNCHMLFFGDDAKGVCKYNSRIFNIDRYMKEETPFHFDPILESFIPTKNREPNILPKFLKRVIMPSGMVGWHVPSMIKKFLFLDTDNHTFTYYFSWVKDQLITAAGNPRFFDIFTGFLKHIYLKSYAHKSDVQKTWDSYYYPELLRCLNLGILLSLAPHACLSHFGVGSILTRKYDSWLDRPTALSSTTGTSHALSELTLFDAFTIACDEADATIHNSPSIETLVSKCVPLTPTSLRSTISQLGTDYIKFIRVAKYLFNVPIPYLPKKATLLTSAEWSLYNSLIKEKRYLLSLSYKNLKSFINALYKDKPP